MNWLKQIVSLILPVTVLVIIPAWVEKHWVLQPGMHFAGGVLLMIAGLSLMAVTIASFVRVGKGTLAPWSPPKKLVVRGPYRYVRNPMIIGVICVLLGEALAFWSRAILMWAGEFFVINIIYFILYEEPGLRARFGEEYSEYKRHVSMWLPRLRPYRPQQSERS